VTHLLFSTLLHEFSALDAALIEGTVTAQRRPMDASVSSASADKARAEAVAVGRSLSS